MSDLLAELKTTVLCGDGAMGTLLSEHGIPAGTCFEELCVSKPEVISAIHREYLESGARILTTNSFGANALKLAAFGHESRVTEINRKAAELAKQATTSLGLRAWVAGSVGPLGVSHSEAEGRGIRREDLFREQISALLGGEVT